MIAVVTGASAGFGAAISRLFVAHGIKVIGIARRTERLQQLHQSLGDNFYPLELDITDKSAVQRALQHLPPQWQVIDILVNNAGLALGLEPAFKADLEQWETVVNTNIKGLLYMTQAVLPQMVQRNRGYIINLGSIAGTYAYPGSTVYGASKAFVKQFSLNLRADLVGTKVRVTNVEPGQVAGTEFSQVRFGGDEDKAQQVYAGVDNITDQDIAEVVLWLAQQPERLNVNRIEIMPTAQTFQGLTVSRQHD